MVNPAYNKDLNEDELAALRISALTKAGELLPGDLSVFVNLAWAYGDCQDENSETLRQEDLVNCLKKDEGGESTCAHV